MTPSPQYAVMIDIRPADDANFSAYVRVVIDTIAPRPVSALEEEAVLRLLKDRWPNAGLSVSYRRPTSSPGVVVWTVWRDREFADRDRAPLYDPPPRP